MSIFFWNTLYHRKREPPILFAPLISMQIEISETGEDDALSILIPLSPSPSPFFFSWWNIWETSGWITGPPDRHVRSGFARSGDRQAGDRYLETDSPSLRIFSSFFCDMILNVATFVTCLVSTGKVKHFCHDVSFPARTLKRFLSGVGRRVGISTT